MKPLLIQLFTGLLALSRTPKGQDESEASIDEQKARIQQVRDEINTMHGDELINDEEVQVLLNDMVEIAATSEPDADYAEFPDFGDKPKKKKKDDDDDDDDDESEPAAEEEAAEEEESSEEEEEPAEEEEPEPEPEPKKETIKERRARLAAEEAAAKKKKSRR